MKSKKLIIGIIIFVIIAGFSGWFIYRDLKHAKESPKVGPLENKTETPAAASSAPSADNTGEIKKQMPDLDREIIIKENLSEESKNRAISEIKIIIATLKADYDQREEWLNLGIWRKTIGDYEGAAEAWKFATIIRPNDPVAFHNLGELYWLHIPNFPLSEKYFLKAIEIGPKNSLFYLKLHELYRYSYKEKVGLADDILVQGIKATDDPGLKRELEDYRKEMGQ
ncbi:MAG: hypothetical protein Q8N81_05820 [bacterium]|nr:hypothetical protein [bacterium]